MRRKNNIFLNHTLQEYNRRYRNYRHKLLSFTEEEVDASINNNISITKDDGTIVKVDVLKNRKWWKIGKTYYEIPRFPRWIWFRNLKASYQVATWVTLGIVVATAVAATGIVHYVKYGDYRIIELEIGWVDQVNLDYTYAPGGVSITLTPKYEGDKLAINTVKIEDKTLQENVEYTFDYVNYKVFIGDEVLNANKGRVEITPKLVNF